MNIDTYLDKFKKPSRIFTREQELTERIWLYFGKKLPFPRIMRMAKTITADKMEKIFAEIKDSNADDKLALFIWKCKK